MSSKIEERSCNGSCLRVEKRKVSVRDGIAALDTHGGTFTARGLGGVASAAWR